MSLEMSGLGALGSFVNKAELVMNYDHNKKVAIGTAVAAIIAIIATVAFAIFFPPAGFAFILGVGTAGVAALALSIVSIAHAARAAKGKSVIDDMFVKIDRAFRSEF